MRCFGRLLVCFFAAFGAFEKATAADNDSHYLRAIKPIILSDNSVNPKDAYVPIKVDGGDTLELSHDKDEQAIRFRITHGFYFNWKPGTYQDPYVKRYPSKLSIATLYYGLNNMKEARRWYQAALDQFIKDGLDDNDKEANSKCGNCWDALYNSIKTELEKNLKRVDANLPLSAAPVSISPAPSPTARAAYFPQSSPAPTPEDEFTIYGVPVVKTWQTLGVGIFLAMVAFGLWDFVASRFLPRAGSTPKNGFTIRKPANITA